MYLNCHSWFSFKYGALSVEHLLKSAQQKGITKLALTDINNTSGILEFVRESHKYGISPVAGIDFRNGVRQQFVGIAKNNGGFLELNDFLSGHLYNNAPMPATAPFFANVFVIYPFATCRITRQLAEYEFIGVKPTDLNRLTFSEWKAWQNKLVILAPVTFENKIDFNVHRLLRAIDNNTLLSKLPIAEQTNADEVFYTEQELETIYTQYPQVIYNTRQLIEQCNIGFEFGTNKNKETQTGSIEADRQKLRQLCIEGIPYRYPNAGANIYERMEKELQMIFDKGFTSYFLISEDIVHYARNKNYYYVGRGSGANSIVAYLLRITDVDPIDLDLYFERFINPFRINPPDFDIDFSWADRDDVIDHIFKTYTTRHTCLLATYSTFQTKAVVRELGKVFGLPKAEIDSLLDKYSYRGKPDKITELISRYSARLNDFPSHLSIHAGGILISEKPIHYYTATSFPPKGFPLSQFSMLEAEDVGLYKFDILSQRGLGHIKDTVEIVRKNKPEEEPIDIHDVKRFKGDEKIKNRIKTADCIGCFYVESPAMRMLLTKLRVDNYLGLVAASSIIRPGVASSGMMRQYILCYRDPSKANYIHPKMKELMEETYGIMVYQEDVIKVAHEFAHLTLGEADMMRRGMSGKFRSREEFAKIKEKFFLNCKEIGYEEETVKEIWRQTESFAGYSFSKGHSASYAVESYQSLFLKAHYPMEFMVGVINNFGGFYRTEYYVHEARMSGATVHAPDINRSEYLTCIYDSDIYLGFGLLAELEQKSSQAVLAERNRGGVFKNLADFTRRVSIAVEQIRILINIGAFRFTGRTKKQLLWDILIIMGADKKTVARKELFEVPGKPFKLPPLFHHRVNDAWDEMEILGFPLCSPFELLKEYSDNNTVAADFKANLGNVVEIIVYYVNHKSTTTIKGEPMMFGTFLDRSGRFIDTTHFPNILAQYPLRSKGCYWIKGKVVEDFDFYSLDVISMRRLDYITRDDVAKLATEANENAIVSVE